MKWIRAMAVPIFWITIAGLGMQHAGSAPASPLANQELKPTRLYVVASESMFTNYIKDDATASLGIWIKKLCELEAFVAMSGSTSLTPSPRSAGGSANERWTC